MTGKSTPTDADRAAPPELRVYRLDDGHWTWCYVDAATDVELQSNTDYPNADDAAAAARQAYPDVPLADEGDTPD